MTRDHVIGSGSGMPWNVPEEYRQFLRFIDGQTVVMGRRSYEIFGPDLTSRHTVVVTRSDQAYPGVVMSQSIDDAMARAAGFGKTVYVAGGATIYRQTLDRVDKMYLSYIKGRFEGDTYFPDFDEARWRIEQRTDHPRFEFVVYARK